MKAATVKQLKDELETRSPVELMQLTLRLSKFKKENKELLTYLLFEANDEAQYIKEIKEDIRFEFQSINTSRYYLIKKSIRKILKRLKTYIRYSDEKETEVELLLFFCKELKALSPSIFKNKILSNTYDRQLQMAKNAINKLHEDLQYDYNLQVEALVG